MPQVRYSAALNEEGELTVIRDVYAGVSGPYGPELAAADVDAATYALLERGFMPTAPWAEHPHRPGYFTIELMDLQSRD